MTTIASVPIISSSPISTAPILQVNDLCVAYGQSQIIKNVSFAIPRGQTVAVLGRNGMGKTTLMKSLIGMLKAQSGHIVVDGVDVTRYPSWDRVKRGLAFVPQGRQVFGLMTVKENLSTGLETVRPRKIDPELYEVFPVLKEMGRRRGGNLSGGQQQQLAIARALASNPKVLLLDEPTEGIQPSVIKDIARILNHIKKIRDLTILVSEQILSFALEIADRILVVEDGRIVHSEDRANVDERKVARFLSV